MMEWKRFCVLEAWTCRRLKEMHRIEWIRAIWYAGMICYHWTELGYTKQPGETMERPIRPDYGKGLWFLCITYDGKRMDVNECSLFFFCAYTTLLMQETANKRKERKTCFEYIMLDLSSQGSSDVRTWSYEYTMMVSPGTRFSCDEMTTWKCIMFEVSEGHQMVWQALTMKNLVYPQSSVGGMMKVEETMITSNTCFLGWNRAIVYINQPVYHNLAPELLK